MPKLGKIITNNCEVLRNFWNVPCIRFLESANTIKNFFEEFLDVLGYIIFEKCRGISFFLGTVAYDFGTCFMFSLVLLGYQQVSREFLAREARNRNQFFFKMSGNKFHIIFWHQPASAIQVSLKPAGL